MASSPSVVNLNVGGKRFSTTTKTLSRIPGSFFSGLISGEIQCPRDDCGTIFIDRDPALFKVVLNFLRSGNIDLRKVSLSSLKQEAKFYGITPLVKQLTACEELRDCSCGSVLFCARLKPPVFNYQLPTVTQEGRVPRLNINKRVFMEQQVIKIVGHLDCIAVAYSHCICVLKARECRGWELIFTTPLLVEAPLHLALNVNITNASPFLGDRMLAASIGTEIRVWSCSPQPKLLTTFDMEHSIDGLSFANNQLIAVNDAGKVAIWQSIQKHWQKQHLSAIGCYVVNGSFLFLGCEKGSIDYIDTEKFPVRLKDNDLLVNQVFDDPHNEAITALSVFMPQNCGNDQSCMEVAYGTKGGGVKVTRYPGNLKHSPSLFQTFDVHMKSVSMILLTESSLVSVCSVNHVRAWRVIRVNGHISSNSGLVAAGSFKITSLDGSHPFYHPINTIGPFGRKWEEQIFIQRIVPSTDTIFVRHATTGHSFCPSSTTNKDQTMRRLLFTGHSNGSLQLWDMSAALEMYKQSSDELKKDCPTEEELVEIIRNSKMSKSFGIAHQSFHSYLPTPCPALLSVVYPEYEPSDSLHCIDTPIFAAQSIVESSKTSPWSTRFVYSPRRYHGGLRVQGRPKSASDLLEAEETLPYSLRKFDSDTVINIDSFPREKSEQEMVECESQLSHTV